MQRYTPSDIEPKWQKIWDESGTYTADLNSSRPKYIAMSMFNYPSGSGIHIGHAMNYTISDVKARFKRQQGYESYHPVGWDSFGLPAENYAITSGVSPQESMASLIPSYHKQYKAMGWSNDWQKEISTHLPEYYKWTQWIFAKMYEAGLAYQDSQMQWWCDIDKTVLANEQVIDGKCWRHDGPNDPLVGKREIKQWFFKITDYADELLESIDDLNWTESVKLAQKNWIGRSYGADINFKVDGQDTEVVVFTTRPDTIFGATFLVLAPEHPLASKLTTKDNRRRVEEYIKSSLTKTEVERQQEEGSKTGVFTGSYALNPINNEKIPIWIADYVIASYGTGAIMAVPAHDERDYQFAKDFDLPIRPVVAAIRGTAQGDEVDKDAIIAVLRNPRTDEILMLDWGPRQDRWGGKLFIGGGIEEGEDPTHAAKREIAEETGYTGIKHVATTTTTVHSYYFSNVKTKNYHAVVTGLLFDLTDDKQSELKLDDGEKDKFKATWLKSAEAEKLVDDDSHRLIYELLTANNCYSGEGLMMNSGIYNDLSSSEAREKIVKDLVKKGVAKEVVNYRMHDWSVSRQRYWGAPIPIINCPKCGPVLVPAENLPVILPDLTDFKPSGDGRSALARATDWLVVNCPKCGGVAERETDTLDTYIDSSWYMYRYFDPFNQTEIFDSKLVKKWEPIDFYNGADHATAHLLYARFIARFFCKIGLLNVPEPFKEFLYNGKVTAADGQMFSKSKGNGVDPLEIIASGYGADALRIYLMFATPLDLWMRWDPKGVPGAYRFLNRLWNLVQEYLEAESGDLAEAQQLALKKITQPMIKKITEDIENNHYNTAIAAAMGALNDLYKLKTKHLLRNVDWQTALSDLVACIAPFAPHIADELWLNLGHSSSIQRDSWPEWEEKYLTSDRLRIAVQINGRVRSELDLPTGASEELALKAAKNDQGVKRYIDQKDIKKVIYIQDRLINLVTD